MKTKILYIFTILVVVISCKTQKQSSTDGKASLVISYSQTAGYGNNPEYEIQLFSNRQMYLTAKKNLDKQGKYMRTLPVNEYNQVIKAFKDADFFSFKDEYTGNITDLPTKYLYFNHKGKEKKIKDYYNAPEKLKELEYMIQSFLDRVGWEKLKW
jgi:hypothetical protein